MVLSSQQVTVPFFTYGINFPKPPFCRCLCWNLSSPRSGLHRCTELTDAAVMALRDALMWQSTVVTVWCSCDVNICHSSVLDCDTVMQMWLSLVLNYDAKAICTYDTAWCPTVNCGTLWCWTVTHRCDVHMWHSLVLNSWHIFSRTVTQCAPCFEKITHVRELWWRDCPDPNLLLHKSMSSGTVQF